MNIRINGEETTIDDGLNIPGLLTTQNVKMPDMVSVELNGRILKRAEFEQTILNEGDQVEFLYFMGGGGLGNRTHRVRRDAGTAGATSDHGVAQ